MNQDHVASHTLLLYLHVHKSSSECTSIILNVLKHLQCSLISSGLSCLLLNILESPCMLLNNLHFKCCQVLTTFLLDAFSSLLVSLFKSLLSCLIWSGLFSLCLMSSVHKSSQMHRCSSYTFVSTNVLKSLRLFTSCLISSFRNYFVLESS